MDFYTAKTQFNNYLKDYDCHNDKIRLKIVHTYGVVKESADIAARMKLSEEDTSLAKIIALLHDIGRFEQLKRFDSFSLTRWITQLTESKFCSTMRLIKI